MTDRSKSTRRGRGVLMTAPGWHKLTAAEHLAAVRHNEGRPYTLERLSAITGISPKTLTKVRRRKQPVDLPTLEAYFQAFDLTPQPEDYIHQGALLSAGSPKASVKLEPEQLKGQLGLDSAFYIERPPAERLCTAEIMRPGALVRLRAPRQFGKTSLITRTISHATENGFRTVVISLRAADQQLFRDLNQFLRWFCAVVARALGLPNQLDTHWDDLFGSIYSCSDYFETYLLPNAESPLLLVIDKVDDLFEHPEIASDFLGMLRAWYEQSRYGINQKPEWCRLRLLISYSTDAWIPLNLHQSPFNVGLLIELPEFNHGQVEVLAQRYGLEPISHYANVLLQLLGGSPSLTQLALFHLSQQHITLETLLQTAVSPEGIFKDHLNYVLSKVERHDLLKPMVDLATASMTDASSVGLQPKVALQLQGLGLIKFENQRAVPQCQLYRQYFGQFMQSTVNSDPDNSDPDNSNETIRFTSR